MSKQLATARRILSREEIERNEPELSDGDMFPGLLSHKAETGGRFESRTGTAGSGKR